VGLFRRDRPEPPVRPDQVARLKAALDNETEAILYDAPDTTYYAKAQAVLDAVRRNSTHAEIDAAHRERGGQA
jgi:hypothetical protein